MEIERSQISLPQAAARSFARKNFPSGSIRVESCPLCGSPERHKDYVGGNTGWAQCKKCSLGYKMQFPTDEEVHNFYVNEYRSESNPGGDWPSRENRQTHVLRHGRQFHLIFQVIDEHKRYLDIGCALGWSVKAAEFIGMEAYGVEPGAKDREWSKEHLDLTIYESLEDLPVRSFDLINMSHVLEHVINPVEYLTELRNSYMADFARIVIEVPHFDAPSAWSAFHAVSFNPETLEQTLRRAGFEVAAVKAKEYDNSPDNLMWAVGIHGSDKHS